MKLWPILLLALAGTAAPAAAAVPECLPERLPAGGRVLGAWIDGGNWLAPGALRAGLRAPEAFMPRQRVAADQAPLPLPPAARPLDLDKLTLADPVDGRQRSLAFLLDSRLYADAVLVLYNGRVFAERAWHDARSDAPALLPQAGRPLLSLLGVVAIDQGKLAAERAVSRYLPALANDAGLRRLSVQRLLEGAARFERSPAEVAAWHRAAGWPGAAPGAAAAAGVRDWLRQPDGWAGGLHDLAPPSAVGGPEDDLLAWLLAESQATPLAQLFCEQLLGRLRPEQPVAWLADAAGNELGGGLVMSLRDFARVGQWLIGARVNPQRSRLPAWFVEALTAPAGKGDNAAALAGLRRGAELRYGFVRLGGPGIRVAIVGAHGTSLYVDFERRLVVALRAAYPEARSPLQLALLEGLWDRLSAALPVPGWR